MFKSDMPRMIPIDTFSFPDAVGSWTIEKNRVDIYGVFYMYFDRLKAENDYLRFEGSSYDRLGPALVSGALTKEKASFVKVYIKGSEMTSCDALDGRVIFEGHRVEDHYEGLYREEKGKENPGKRFVLKISDKLLKQLETSEN